MLSSLPDDSSFAGLDNQPADADSFNRNEVWQFLKMKEYLRTANRAKVFGKALMLFLIQVCLISTLYIYFRRNPILTIPSSSSTMGCGYVVVLMGHLFIQPIVLNCLNSMKYLFTHSDDFQQVFLPFMLCVMRLVVAINVQVLSILASFTIDDDLWVVMNYICLLTIVYIDESYLDMLNDVLQKHFD